MNDDKRVIVSTDGALNVDFGSLSVVIDLRERLRGITADQVASSARRFKPRPKNMKEIGCITSENTRALHALWMSLDAEADFESAKAKLATHEEIETDHRERHNVLENLAGVAKEMWWVQARSDLGFHKCVGVGIYQDWMLVERAEPPEGGRLMSLAIGGGPMFPFPSGDDE